MMPIFDDSTTKEAEKKHQLDVDFSKAMQKAFWEELKAFILRRSIRLLPFDEVKDKLEIWFVRDLGLQTVSIDRIVGSESRYRSFTRHFLPLEENLRDRWKKVAQAHYFRQNLPPVELYRVQDVYFVKDGHHRVSVARAKGVRNIEAHVYEYECDVPLNEGIDLEKLAIQETYHQFLRDTQLGKKRPHPRLQLTLLGGYPVLMDHIQTHQYYLGKEKGKEIPISEAACSWYDNLYTPLASIIRKNRIMRQFPHRTETDFYLWMIQHRRQLINEHGWTVEPESIVEAYTKKHGGIFRKILGPFRRFFRLVRY
ncbi:MAG: hypothetical protein U9R17_18305 [Thermodesulfobacteriota bacterium]|nr:hypothetical protein [Thermodesulfobacteriota bacterium]